MLYPNDPVVQKGKQLKRELEEELEMLLECTKSNNIGGHQLQTEILVTFRLVFTLEFIKIVPGALSEFRLLCFSETY